MSDKRLIAALSLVAPHALSAEGLQPSCCVAATHAGLDVLAAWKIKAKPLLCVAHAYNAWWVAGDRTPGRAWAVDIDVDAQGPGFSGHVVIVGKVGRDHFLLDLSATQMHRSHKGIIIESGILVATKGPLMEDWSIGVVLPKGGLLSYSKHSSPETCRYQNAPDWRLPTPGHRSRHEATVRRLRAEAEVMYAADREEPAGTHPPRSPS